jgi:Mce-associated membrane protein
VTEKTADQTVEAPDAPDTPDEAPAPRPHRWPRVVAYGVLPALAFTLAVAAAVLGWQDHSARQDVAAGDQAMQAACDTTAAILSYQPDTADQHLTDVTDHLLTGDFQNSYRTLITTTVIPGAKAKTVTAAATVSGSGVMSADPHHAVVLLFVDQSVTVGAEPPARTTSSVRVTLDKVGGRWLISGFQPV